MVTSSRSNRLVARVQKIEAALPPLEKSVLAQRNHLHFAYTAGMPFWSPLPNSLNQGKVTVRMGGNWFNFSNSDMPAYDRNDVPNSSTNKVLLVGNTSTLVYLECLFLLLKWLLFPVLRVFFMEAVGVQDQIGMPVSVLNKIILYTMTCQDLSWIHMRNVVGRHACICLTSTWTQIYSYIYISWLHCYTLEKFTCLFRFDPGGPGSCLKRYSDPTFFKRASVGSDEEYIEKVLKEKKGRKIKVCHE